MRHFSTSSRASRFDGSFDQGARGRADEPVEGRVVRRCAALHVDQVVPDAVGALFVLALHFSVAFSRLSEETKILAQEVARLDREQP